MFVVKKENSPDLDDNSIMCEAIRCVKALLEKYSGADVTKDMLVRIALEAYASGRLRQRSSPTDLDFLH